MSKDPRIKALASEAAIKIKALTEAHEIQIEEIYREYRAQAAQVQEGNGEELQSPTVTSIQSPPTELKDSHDFTLSR